ncbi:15-hydroxyprostaglandin dehydrogenase [NAD(+)]-like [Saccoglossus kowalevskii]|uniref:15-hydroxyprostaglandin dehydrogenase [NAD(+)] n=1 Tax=Saccoglossus kowalevskii TaxID=10224 RepID=A0ABM0H1S8_SACKO|nr:PREDICTED: 15-hydroxyprostaglandin dehydrogenase [NAD(+)]-like [Saccoglossus kowalevskii]
MNRMNIEGKVALVTGAGHVKGIGYAIAHELLRKNAKCVALLDINDLPGHEARDELRKQFSKAVILYIHCDVSSKSSLEGAFEKVKSHFGCIDIVCNNAAVPNETDWESTVNVNLIGTIRGTYLALDHMGVSRGGGGGVVINTSSCLGIITRPYSPVYGATKHGIVAFTRSIADNNTFKKNKVRVSAICPAKMDRPMRNVGSTMIPDFEELRKYADSLSSTPKSHITDTVVKLIENTEYNGTICVVLPDDPMKIIEPQTLTLV